MKPGPPDADPTRPASRRRRIGWWMFLAATLLNLGSLYVIYGPRFALDAMHGFLAGLGLTHGHYSKVWRIKADHRSLATAIESYYVDHDTYPPMRPLRDATRAREAVIAAGGGDLHVFAPEALAPLYISEIPTDDFIGPRTPRLWRSGEWFSSDPAPFPEGIPYAYHQAGPYGWLLVSPGPDGDYDIRDPAAVYNPADPLARIPSDGLVELTYDPTNGRGSSGDVYRLKQ